MNVVPEDAGEIWLGNSKIALQNQFKTWFIDGLYTAVRIISSCSQGAEPEKDGETFFLTILSTSSLLHCTM